MSSTSMERGVEGEHGDAVAYAVGALGEAGRARFEAHVATCPECLRELEEVRPIVDQLGLSVRQSEPPAALKTQLLARARGLTPLLQPVLQPATAAERAPIAPPGPALSSVRPTVEPVVMRPPVALTRPPRRWWQAGERVATFTAAASLAIALAGSGYAFTAHQQLQATTYNAAQLAETISLMYQPDMVSRRLSGTENSPNSKGMIYLDPGGTEAVVMVSQMPRLPQDQAYQCWLQDREDGSRASAGLFHVDQKGRGRLIVRSPGTLSRFRALGVTKEPAKGSPGPTSPPMLSGQL